MELTAQEILKEYWGFNSFRPLQNEIIHSLLDGNDTLALLPTGGGKSICFQVPALMMDGLCIVISPLIALMKDQEAHLKEKNISVASIHSGLSNYEVNTILQEAVAGEFKFLYLSPERLESSLFKAFLPELHVSFWVVDEAHCVSQWGYDFRPSYLKIAEIRKYTPSVPMMALTASATKLVQKDILQQLQMQDAICFKQSFEKPNLSYSVFKVESKLNKLLDILNAVPGSGIVYCNNRKQTKAVAEFLKKNKINADYYHAGLTATERSEKQDSWVNNEITVMVCTNAFGLGIDKPDVRKVIHYDAPECIESYYQEAGRAGRDEQKAYAVLLYHVSDLESLEEMADKRYPSIPTIKAIYQEIANYLQLPIGSGEHQFFDFDLYEFVSNFKLDRFLVSNTLKILEQEGHCILSENIFLPSRICFSVNKDELYSFENNYTDLEPIIKTLLRTYPSIFDNSVSIYEKQISRILRIPVELVIQQLEQLDKLGIIEYEPLKDTPQIYFSLNRAPAEYLHIDQDAYLKRKKQYQFRLDSILQYLQLNTGCRSIYISQYFGEKTDKQCGKCDHCLAAKANAPSNHQILEMIKDIELKLNGINMVQDLLKKYQDEDAALVWAALKYMQSEQSIHIAETGKISKPSI